MKRCTLKIKNPTLLWSLRGIKYMNTWSTTVSVPSSELGPPLPQASVPPLRTGGGEGVHTLACVQGDGAGESQFGRLEKRLGTLSTWSRPLIQKTEQCIGGHFYVNLLFLRSCKQQASRSSQPPHLNHKIKMDPSLQFKSEDPESSSWIILYYIFSSSVADPWHFGVDPVPDPAVFVIDLQDANK